MTHKDADLLTTLNIDHRSPNFDFTARRIDLFTGVWQRYKGSSFKSGKTSPNQSLSVRKQTDAGQIVALGFVPTTFQARIFFFAANW